MRNGSGRVLRLHDPGYRNVGLRRGDGDEVVRHQFLPWYRLVRPHSVSRGTRMFGLRRRGLRASWSTMQATMAIVRMKPTMIQAMAFTTPLLFSDVSVR